MATVTGLIFSIIVIIWAVVTVIHKIMRQLTELGWPSIMVAICFFSGIILLFMGVIGEYIGRIFLGMSNNPQFVVRALLERADEKENQPEAPAPAVKNKEHVRKS